MHMSSFKKIKEDKDKIPFDFTFFLLLSMEAMIVNHLAFDNRTISYILYIKCTYMFSDIAISQA